MVLVADRNSITKRCGEGEGERGRSIKWSRWVGPRPAFGRKQKKCNAATRASGALDTWSGDPPDPDRQVLRARQREALLGRAALPRVRLGGEPVASCARVHSSACWDVRAESLHGASARRAEAHLTPVRSWAPQADHRRTGGWDWVIDRSRGQEQAAVRQPNTTTNVQAVCFGVVKTVETGEIASSCGSETQKRGGKRCRISISFAWTEAFCRAPRLLQNVSQRASCNQGFPFFRKMIIVPHRHDIANHAPHK